MKLQKLNGNSLFWRFIESEYCAHNGIRLYHSLHILNVTNSERNILEMINIMNERVLRLIFSELSLQFRKYVEFDNQLNSYNKYSKSKLFGKCSLIRVW